MTKAEHQQIVTTLSSGSATYSTAAIRLVSLNYGKTIELVRARTATKDPVNHG